MGTLFEQRPRDYYHIGSKDIKDFLDEVVDIASDHELPVHDVIYAIEVLELRRKNNLYAWNGDAFDEQMAGFGELFQELNAKIDMLSTAVEGISNR